MLNKFSCFTLLTILASIALINFASAESPLADLKAPPAETQKVDKPVVNDQGGVVYSPLLPTKIHPRQTTADGLSIAAATIEQEADKVDEESIGLISTGPEGAFATTLWQGFSQNDVRGLLTNETVQTPSPTMLKLIRRALISKPDATLISESPAPTPVEGIVPTVEQNFSLFQLRLEKLLALGLYRDAFQMYRKLGDHGVKTPRTAYAGVQSMIGSGQLGTACLENRVIAPAQKLAEQQKFWSELNQFCELLLSPASAQDKNEYDALGRASKAYAELNLLKTIPSSDALKTLSPIELIAYHRSNRIGKGVLSEQTLQSMAGHQLAALYAVTPPRSDQAYEMLSHLIRRGIKTPNDLISAYKNHAQALRKQSQAQGRDLKKNTKTKDSAWTNVALIYADLISADQSAPPATLIKNALNASTDLPATSLTPFASFMAELDNLSGFSENDAQRALYAFLSNNINAPKAWVLAAYPTESASLSATSGDELLLEILSKDEAPASSPVSSTGISINEAPASLAAQATEKPEKSALLAEKSLLKAYLSGEPNSIKAAQSAYDNLFSLTGNSNYVMHNEELRNELSDSVSAGAIGKVVLKSVIWAEGKPASTWNATQFSVLLNSLYSVGLGEDIKSLIRERMIGQMK